MDNDDHKPAHTCCIYNNVEIWGVLTSKSLSIYVAEKAYFGGMIVSEHLKEVIFRPSENFTWIAMIE